MNPLMYMIAQVEMKTRDTQEVGLLGQTDSLVKLYLKS
jgi:hypothetical protein